MRYVSDWGSPNRRSLLSFSEAVLQVFEEHAQLRQGMPESGGLLLGKVRGEHLEVLHATRPSLRDSRHRFFFERAPFSHRNQAKRYWKESGGLIRYLGEWHTHPEAHPTPSRLDRVEWNKLAAQRQDQRPVLVAVVGTRTLWVEQVYSGKNGVRMEALSR